MEVIFILVLFVNTLSRTTDRIHEFYQDGKNVVFRTNDFMPLLDATKPVNLRVVFWKKGSAEPLTIEKGETRVNRVTFFAIINVRVNGEGRFLVQFSQDGNPCAVNYYFTLVKNQLPNAKIVTAQRDCH